MVGQGELACKRCLGEEQVSSQNDPELVRRVKGILEGRPGGRLAWNPHDKGWLGNPSKLVSGPQACRHPRTRAGLYPGMTVLDISAEQATGVYANN